MTRATRSLFAATFGNCPLDKVLINIKKTLLACSAYDDIPVFAGAAEQLIQRPHLRKGAGYWHGEDGLGDATAATVIPSHQPGRDSALRRHARLGDLDYDTSAEPGRNAAVDAIISIVREHPGEITLVALGPLTNVRPSLSPPPAPSPRPLPSPRATVPLLIWCLSLLGWWGRVQVALAVKQDPGIVHLVKDFIFMGGVRTGSAARHRHPTACRN